MRFSSGHAMLGSTAGSCVEGSLFACMTDDAGVKPTPNKRLQNERKRRCWTQEELADKVGTTPLNISRWERGLTVPGPHFRRQLCEIFEKTPQELGFVVAKVEESEPIPTPASSHSPSLTPSSLWHIPYRRNPFFTGRDDVLSILRTALLAQEAPVAFTYGSDPQALSGLGGIGKTQTAVEYAYRHRESYDYVLWARADSFTTLASDFMIIASLLHLPERNEQEQGKVVEAVVNWLSLHTRWLLILDNADTLEMVSEFMPSTEKGHIIITTRAQATGTVAQRIELEKMSKHEGTLFLLRRIKRLRVHATIDDVSLTMRNQAMAIVEAVDGLPLALDQAGAYIEETYTSLTDYLKLYTTRRKRLLRTRGRDAVGHPEPVATTWSLSFENVTREHPAAAQLLQLCAFLQPDAIPETMLEAGASELGTLLQPIAEDTLERNDAMRVLLRYSLIRRDADEKILNMHRLVQAVLKDALSEDEQRLWAERTVRMLWRAFPEGQEFANWSHCQQYLPHALIGMELLDHYHLLFAEAAGLFYQAGVYLRVRARFKEAKPLLQKALVLYQQTLAAEHSDTAHALTKLGEVWYEQGELDEAEPLYTEALTMYKTLFGEEHVTIARVTDNLALLYHTRGDLERAGPLYRAAFEMRERLLGLEHAEVALSLSNWASLYYDLAQYEQAGQLIQRALAIHEKLLGAGHPDIAEDLNNLAMIYIEQEKYADAEQYLLRALEIWDSVMGPDYHHAATTMGNLGYLYYVQGKYEQATTLYQRGLMIYEKTVGRVHYSVASSLNNLGKIYSKQGNDVQAEAMFLEAVSIYEKTLGAEHPYASTSYNGLAHLYQRRGDYAKAETLFRRVITIKETLLGQNNPEMAPYLTDYATFLRLVKRIGEAEVVERRVQALGDL